MSGCINLLKLYEDRNIFKICLQGIIPLYSVCVILNTISYVDTFFIIVLMIASYFAVMHFSLPPGDPLLVKEILGSDVYDLKSDDIVNSDSSKSDKDFIMKVVAHRFAGLDAPENSLIALETAHKAGCTAVEFDISMTSDNCLILFHDDTLERLASLPGRVSNMKWEQLKSVNISVNHPFREQFDNARIALFEAAVEKCLEYDMRMFIDIKDSKPQVIDGVCKMFEKYPMMYRRAIISSFNPSIIYQIRSRKPSIVGCLAWRPYTCSHKNYIPENFSAQERRSASTFKYYLARFGDFVHRWAFFNILHLILGLSCVLVHKDTINKESIVHWRSKNIRCIAWTVNQPSEKQHFAKNLRITYLTDTMHAD